MIKLKCEEGKCHLQMEGSALDIARDVVTALNAIMHGFNKNGHPATAYCIKGIVRDWAKGDFDDTSESE